MNRDNEWPFKSVGWAPAEIAKRFHDAYELLAPDYGYTTRADTRRWDPDSANGMLMIAVVRTVLIDQYRKELKIRKTA